MHFRFKEKPQAHTSTFYIRNSDNLPRYSLIQYKLGMHRSGLFRYGRTEPNHIYLSPFFLCDD